MQRLEEFVLCVILSFLYSESFFFQLYTIMFVYIPPILLNLDYSLFVCFNFIYSPGLN